MGGGRQRQKTEHSFLKFEKKEELELCENAQQDLELLLRKKEISQSTGDLNGKLVVANYRQNADIRRTGDKLNGERRHKTPEANGQIK